MTLLRIFLLFMLLGFITARFTEQAAPVSTCALIDEFCKAWNAEGMGRMESLLDPEAFFKSPYQLRNTLDTMLATVLSLNPPVYKVIRINETPSEMRDDLEWSIVDMVSEVFDDLS
jgi:hypothetical protein